MISEASCSKTPPPTITSPPSMRLAPGFRFNPTDEELVSYYLKRKVTNRPIRVDAISEVDLYKLEPWDLPPYSRLRSRDLGWYFFTAVERKYSNGSRNNRATAEGYWKTTGRDRPVRHRSQTIGMKKTLVYHAGRAPRGHRTNWVMHEYRLEDEGLSHAGIPQDGYVLCRVFQKIGPGPQNGAQYGAPYEEEEWERYGEDDANLVPGNDAFIDPANEDCVHLADFLQNQDAGIQHFDVFPLMANSAEQDIGRKAEGSMEDVLKDETSVEDFIRYDDFQNQDDEAYMNQDAGIQHFDGVPLMANSAEQDTSIKAEGSMVEILKDEASVEDFARFDDFPALQDNKTILNGFWDNSTMEDLLNGASIQNTGYVQLNDIIAEENSCFISNGYSNDCLLWTHDDISDIDRVGHSETLSAKHVTGNLFDTNGASSLADQLQICPVQHDMNIEPSVLCDVPLVYASAQLTEDNLMYYDALANDLQYLEEGFTKEASLVPRFEYDFLEELVAYYDATDDALHYATTDSFGPECLQVNPSHFDQSSFSTEAVVSCASSLDAAENVAKCASLEKESIINNILGGSIGNLSAEIKKKDPEGKALMKHLGSMLESISAPPAFAAESAVIGKMSGQISMASTSSLQITTARMIQTPNSTAMGYSESWILPKHGESSVLFSYGMDDKVASKSALHEPRKVHCGFFSSLFRVGFLSFFLSALILALSYRVGVYVYNL